MACYVGLFILEHDVYDTHKMSQVNFFDAAASLNKTKKVAVDATTALLMRHDRRRMITPSDTREAHRERG